MSNPYLADIEFVGTHQELGEVAIDLTLRGSGESWTILQFWIELAVDGQVYTTAADGFGWNIVEHSIKLGEQFFEEKESEWGPWGMYGSKLIFSRPRSNQDSEVLSLEANLSLYIVGAEVVESFYLSDILVKQEVAELILKAMRSMVEARAK